MAHRKVFSYYVDDNSLVELVSVFSKLVVGSEP